MAKSLADVTCTTTGIPSWVAFRHTQRGGSFSSGIDSDASRREDMWHRRKRLVASRLHRQGRARGLVLRPSSTRLDPRASCGCHPELPRRRTSEETRVGANQSRPGHNRRERCAGLLGLPCLSSPRIAQLPSRRCGLCNGWTVLPASSTCTATAMSILSTHFVHFSSHPTSLDGTGTFLPGGRYSCAEAFVQRSLSFFDGFFPCRICHIVRLAVSQKKVVCHLQGALRTPTTEGEWMCDRCVSKFAWVTHTHTHTHLHLATWGTARTSLRYLEGSSSLPVSIVERFVRTRCGLELSETVFWPRETH